MQFSSRKGTILAAPLHTTEKQEHKRVSGTLGASTFQSKLPQKQRLVQYLPRNPIFFTQYFFFL
ncbi:hypothetical protein [Silvibacterium acidisoli]|uniref:hypothetical protein n=1 Tax=Acidobacteriaceae bacterium ZG23-2 TaxID=2883246 RepID=UPI00406CC5BF